VDGGAAARRHRGLSVRAQARARVTVTSRGAVCNARIAIPCEAQRDRSGMRPKRLACRLLISSSTSTEEADP
jgi:hypothetical protein